MPDFFLDKFEVTNSQFQQFVSAGGYRDQKYWRHPFVRNGQAVPVDEALASFRDATGRPGPASWELGTFAKNTAEHPVSGVSWFEATACCEYAGKSLPTLHHWWRAAGVGIFSEILLFSNFGSGGTAPVGSFAGIGPFGTFDMAGNVKEWSSNATGDRRALLGGGWNEHNYRFMDRDAQDPFLRSATSGVRCAISFARPARSLRTTPAGNA
ncbi:MAG: SUMF1/EgtB/PvdO family nonheme iron enzyme [Bryobacteraceae bacterium]|nr:SUMF1/EgtB/PvdO family nonheme iron enzyme [Bryobacteraceae bacterium]